MENMAIRILVTLIIIGAFGSSVVAAPNIESIAGTSTLTITGTGFESKATPAAKADWDGATDSLPAGVNLSDVTHNSTNQTDASHKRYSTQNYYGRYDFAPSGEDNSGMSFTKTVGSRNWYARICAKLASNWRWSQAANCSYTIDKRLCNVKYVRFYPAYTATDRPNEGTLCPNTVAANHMWISPPRAGAETEMVSSGTGYTWDLSAKMTLNTWHCLEYEFKDSSAVDAADGILRTYFDGELVDNQTTLKTSTSDDARVRTYATLKTWATGTVYANGYYLGPAVGNGYYYTQASGGNCTSHASDTPSWDTTPSSTTNDNDCRWTNSGVFAIHPMKYLGLLGFYDSWADTASIVETQYNYWSGVYIDTTFQRVMLCPGATWTNRGVCEPQIITTWGTTEITVTYREGTLPLIKYAYVVDSTGTANANGFPMGAIYPKSTIGTTGPAAKVGSGPALTLQ